MPYTASGEWSMLPQGGANPPAPSQPATPPSGGATIPSSGSAAPGGIPQNTPGFSVSQPGARPVNKAMPGPAAPNLPGGGGPGQGGIPGPQRGMDPQLQAVVEQGKLRQASQLSPTGFQSQVTPGQGQPLGGPATAGGGQGGVGGLGPLLQLLMGGGGRAGSNPIMSLLQMLAARGGGGGNTPIATPGFVPSSAMSRGGFGGIPNVNVAPTQMGNPGVPNPNQLTPAMMAAMNPSGGPAPAGPSSLVGPPPGPGSQQRRV
jgi:hypothetical protein